MRIQAHAAHRDRTRDIIAEFLDLVFGPRAIRSLLEHYCENDLLHGPCPIRNRIVDLAPIQQ